MGQPPAFLFVVRHGYRLDAADKQWHLSSPTPYDPPLTYSGWQQAKSLGVRIASILRERILEDELAASHITEPSAKRKRKRYEVVLHSSPFLRCIQTSIGISAGLAQNSAPFEHPSAVPPSTTPTSPSHDRPRPTGVTDLRNATSPSVKVRKSVLRLDAFLGEWLSPSYFELITPPPESVMMLASAKADLLRREDYTHYPNLTYHSQGQLWSPTGRESSASPPKKPESKSATNSRTTLQGSPGPYGRGDQRSQSEGAGYVSPVPHYAISSNNTIPPGYVSHARDACVSIDYQWHSTRSALDWGDGGTFPEEWAAMHKRFRAGAQSLVDWYSTADMPTRPVTRTVRATSVDGSVSDEEDVEVEAVVILVTHGAGCNALIGAITHQPVLMDVGMASLTVAVRKPNIEHTHLPAKSTTTPPVHELYDLKLFANTDHLRSPAATPTGPRSSSSMSDALNSIRGRHSSFSTSVNTFSWNDGPGNRKTSANSALSGLRKSPPRDAAIPRLSFTSNTGGITIGSGVTSFAATRPSTLGGTGSTGLWSPIATQFEDDEEDDEIPVLNFSFDKPSSAGTTSTAAPALDRGRESNNTTGRSDAAADGAASGGSGISDRRSLQPEPEQLGGGSGGLWGVPRPPDDADRLRDLSGSKRRWTVTERG